MVIWSQRGSTVAPGVGARYAMYGATLSSSVSLPSSTSVMIAEAVSVLDTLAIRKSASGCTSVLFSTSAYPKPRA